MNNQKLFDAEKFKQDQVDSWDSLAEYWLKWEHLFEVGAQPVNQWVLDDDCLKEGANVLDLASGLGQPAIAIADKIGPTGFVYAVEQSPGMARVAASRAREKRNIQVIEDDVETTSFPDAHFDAIVSRWGLMFMPNLNIVFKKCYHYLKNRGRLLAIVWASPPDVPIISLAFGVVASVLELSPPSPGTPTPFCMSNPDIIRIRLAQAGFSGITIDALDLPFMVSGFKEYKEFSWDLFPPFIKKRLAESGKEKIVWGRVRDQLRQYRWQNGRILTSRALCVRAEK